jgi:hypothetical protein
MISTKPPVFPLHDYHPRIVDEHLLTPEQRREEFIDSLRLRLDEPPDESWRKYLKPAELEEHAELLQQYNQDRRRTRAVEAARQLEMIGRRRARASQLYSQGERYWCGDGSPPWAGNPH